MRGESYGLRTLKMGVARHDSVLVLLRLGVQSFHKLLNKLHDLRHVLFQIQPDIKRHLVVAAAPRVQALARITYAAGKLALNEGVNILRIGVYKQFTGDNIVSDGGKPGENTFTVLF